MPKVAVIIVTDNCERYLPDTLASLDAQDFRDFTPVFVDNASADGTVSLIRSFFPNALLLKNSKHLGYGRAFNQAVVYAQAQLAKGGSDLLVASLAPGLVMKEDCLRSLVSVLERHSDAAGVTGVVARARRNWEDSSVPIDKTGVIDSAGLTLRRDGLIVRRGVGEIDDGSRYQNIREVFGVPGAMSLYRCSALGEAVGLGVMLDESFAVGYEHEELSWRLRLLGFSFWLSPDARAWTTVEGTRDGLVGDLRRARGARWVRRKFFHNRLLTYWRSVHTLNAIIDLPWTLSTGLVRAMFLLLISPRALFGALGDGFRSVPGVLFWRWRIFHRRRCDWKEIRRWYPKIFGKRKNQPDNRRK